MSNYWPSGLELSDTQSPREILKVAQEEWYTSSEGVMELVLQDAESESGNSMNSFKLFQRENDIFQKNSSVIPVRLILVR